MQSETSEKRAVVGAQDGAGIKTITIGNARITGHTWTEAPYVLYVGEDDIGVENHKLETIKLEYDHVYIKDESICFTLKEPVDGITSVHIALERHRHK